MTKRLNETNTVLFLIQNAAKIPLLSGEQEIQLGRKVQAMMKVLELPENDRPEDWEFVIRQGQRAKNRMIESNLRLVVNVAKKYQNMGLPFEDLIQEGSIGLNRGVEKFDPERGYKASTYLFPWIRQSITRAIANQSRMIRLPVYMKEWTLKLKQLHREFMQRDGKRPSAETLREAMDLSEDQWKILMSSLRDATSYDISVSLLESETTLIDIIPSDQTTPQEQLDEMGERQRLDQILNEIGEKEARVLGLRYGIDQDEGRTLKEIGEMMGVTRERIRQIEKKAMESARKVAVQAQMIA
jgi:RNA polymerase sigma factor (sigma-70 family)